MAARLWNSQFVAYAPEQDDPVQPIGFGTTTAAGSSTTIVDVGGIADSSGADYYNGQYWVTILSGTYKGQSKRVVDDDGDGTLTLESAFAGAPGSGIEYQLWKSSEPMILVDSSADATTVVDALRDEADDYWIGCSIEPITGNRSGEVELVTDFVSATGTFTTGSFSGALAAGDVCYLRRAIEAVNLSAAPAQPYVPSESPRLDLSRGKGRPGARSGTVSFDLPVRGSGSLAGADVVATAAEMHGLMQACGYVEVTGKTMTIDDAAASTTVIDVAAGDGANVEIGQAIQYNGNVSYVTDQTVADTLTVSPPFPVAPADTDLLHASRTYRKYRPSDDTQPKGVTIYTERDGVRTTYFGCMGNVEFLAGGAGELVGRFSFTATHWVLEDDENLAGEALYEAYASTQKILGSELTAYLDTTQVDVHGVAINGGHAYSPKTVAGKYGLNGVATIETQDVRPMIRLGKLIAESDDAMAAEAIYQVGTSKAVSLVYGSHGNCIAFRAPAARLIEAPVPGDYESRISTPYVLECQNAGTGVDANESPTQVKIPDFSIHIF